MKYILVLVLVALCFALTVGEKKAGYCGAGILSPNLPNDSMIDWFNGQAIFADYQSFHLIFQGKEITIGSSSVEVAKILEYQFNNDFVVVRFESKGGDTYVISTSLQPANSLVLLNGYKEDEITFSEWISVKPSDCFYGRWFLIRVFFLLAITVIIFKLFTAKKQLL